jgi:foldase protein PrsA
MWRHSGCKRAAALLGLILLLPAAGCGAGTGADAPRNDSKTVRATPPPGAGRGRVVAVYKGGNVTESEFRRYASFFSLANPESGEYLTVPALKEQLLREYIGYKWLYMRIGGKPNGASKEEAAALAEAFERTIAGDSQRRRERESSGLSKDDVLWYYEMIATVMNDFDRQVTEREMRAAFAKRPNDFNRITLRHILIGYWDPASGRNKRTRDQALDIAMSVRRRLMEGGDWDELARRYSDDEATRNAGGLYIGVEAGTWIEPFKKAANSQPIGAIGEPVDTGYGFHIIQVKERKRAVYDRLPEASRQTLRRSVSNERLASFMASRLPEIIERIDLFETAESMQDWRSGRVIWYNTSIQPIEGSF